MEIHGLNDLTRDGDTLIYQFTQEKTLSFTTGERITFQCDVLVGNQRYRVLDSYSKVEDTNYPEVMGNG